jgi:CelD/BcsL family acetyltransferase involved in cellulose biosynthesis
MRVELKSWDEVTPSDQGAWAELAAVAQEPNPFFEPGFVDAAARSLGGDDVGLLLAREGSTWVACMPVHRPSRWRRLPIPVLAGWAHPYSYLGTPLVAEGRSDAAEALAVRGLEDPRAGLFVLDRVAPGGIGAPLLETMCGNGHAPVEEQRSERAVLRRRPEPDYISDTLNTHHRRELSRSRRRLEEELDGPLEAVDDGGDPDAVRDFLALEYAGWKGRAGSAMACSIEGARFFEELCARFALDGRVQMLRLRSDGRTVAMKCNFFAGDGLFCFKIAFDESLARYSPGVQLEVENVAIFHHDTDARWMDSCADPDNQMINRLWPDRRELVDVAVRAHGSRGRLAGAVARRAVDLRRRIGRG